MINKDQKKLQLEFLNLIGEEYGQGLFDYINDIQFWIKDDKSRYIKVNDCFLKHYLLKDESMIIGKTDFDLSLNHIADQFIKDDNIVLKGQKIINRVELVGNFGMQIDWFITCKLPVRSKSGKVIGTTGMTKKLVNENLSNIPMGKYQIIINSIEKNISQNISNIELAKLIHLSQSAFEKNFKKYFHISPQQYIKRRRLDLACHELINTDNSIIKIALKTGFNDQSFFTKEFKNIMGLPPKEFRNQYSKNLTEEG